MTNIKFLPIAIAAIFVPANIQATGTDNTSGKPIKVYPKPQSKGNRMPSRYYINAQYQNGELTFDIPADVEFLSVTVRHDATDQIWYNVVDEQFPTMEIGTLSGSYTITVITDADSEFTGSFSL